MTQCRNWPQTVLRPSFRGVPFQVEEDVKGGGRRIVTHEYASREFWALEDMGRASTTVQVRGYVHGDDADRQAETLAEALASEGAGTLVLPARPISQARCTAFHSTFASDSMGRIPFDMEFTLEAESKGGLVPTTLLGIAVHNAVTAVAGTVADVFSLAFDTLKRRFDSAPVTVPALARDAAVVTITRAATALDQARRQVGGADPTGAAKLEFAARDIRDRARDLAYAGQVGSRVDQDTYAADETVVAAGLARGWRHAPGPLLAVKRLPRDASAPLSWLYSISAQ